MKNIKKLALSLASLLVVSSLAMAAPAQAQNGQDDAATDPPISDQANDMKVHNLTNRLKEQGETELKTHKQEGRQKTVAERQKACTARQNNLNKKMANSVSWAKKHKSVIDTAYARVKAFHDSKKLEVSNYDTLTAAVDLAQANAQTSIEALETLNVKVDCTSQTPASSVSAFKQAVKDTRDSLKDYRKALVSLITALKGASTGTHTEDSSPTNNTEQ
ncbi:hypothetical protein KW794_01385 [Candidatus Saccharibacteria bacterium]|nr:hypothetical protein [Candidatus Saccharibacteria bacterium]